MHQVFDGPDRACRGRPRYCGIKSTYRTMQVSWIKIEKSERSSSHALLMGRSSSAELTGKILCCHRISKPPADDGAIAIAVELTALRCDAVPGVKFVYLVQPCYEIPERYNRIYKV